MGIKIDSLNLKTLFWVLANQISFSKMHFRNSKIKNEMRTKLTTPNETIRAVLFRVRFGGNNEICRILGSYCFPL